MRRNGGDLITLHYDVREMHFIPFFRFSLFLLALSYIIVNYNNPKW